MLTTRTNLLFPLFFKLQEVVLLAEVAGQHESAFGRVMWDKLAAEHFPRRATQKLRNAYKVYKAADVSSWGGFGFSLTMTVVKP